MSDEGSPGIEGGAGSEPRPVETPEFPPPPGGWGPPSAPDLAPVPPQEAPRSFRRGRVWLAAVLAAIVLVTGGIGIGWLLTRSGGSVVAVQAPLTTAPPASTDGGSGQELGIQAITAQVGPAVVDINVVVLADTSGGTAEAAGTGMIVTSSGQILTNNHVIQGATRIEVAIPGRSGTYTAEVVGADPSDDIALLQVHGVSGLRTVTLGDSSSLMRGDRVVAIGNALGRGGAPSVTQGTVVAVGRSITVSDQRGGTEQLSGLIETDAPIQPGESGGPLVNSAGQVVGMITAAARESRFDTTSRVSFAITSNFSLTIVNEIRAGHESDSIFIGPSGFMGIQVRDLDSATAAQLGIGVNSGALVVGVVPGGPADEAGISAGSVITAINGEGVSTSDELGPAIQHHDPGEDIQVTWVDEDGTHTATVTLTTGPAV